MCPCDSVMERGGCVHNNVMGRVGVSMTVMGLSGCVHDSVMGWGGCVHVTV